MERQRVLLLAKHDDAGIAQLLRELCSALTDRIEIVGKLPPSDEPLPSDLNADIAIAVGGDGTLISQARRIVDHNIPLIGLNIGRLGFLAEFDLESLIEHAEVVFGPDPPIHEHMLLSVSVLNADGSCAAEQIAMNDGVITAGEPFRVIELDLIINDAAGPSLHGDGMIVATPVGSTAYNVSAGGPIVYPRLEAMTITPLAAHSLAFRPIVLDGSSVVRATLRRANPGTSLVADGQNVCTIREGQTIEFRRYSKKSKLVINPGTTYWRILLDKLRWAAPPNYRDGTAQ